MRERLEAQGLSTEGTKPILLARLREGLAGPVVKTPDVLTPGGRRSKRLSESGEAATRPDTPLKRGRVTEVRAASRLFTVRPQASALW